MVSRKFRWLIIVTFFLTGCKTYLNEVELKELMTGKVTASQLSDDPCIYIAVTDLTPLEFLF